jgi:hypothetical protein
LGVRSNGGSSLGFVPSTPKPTIRLVADDPCGDFIRSDDDLSSNGTGGGYEQAGGAHLALARSKKWDDNVEIKSNGRFVGSMLLKNDKQSQLYKRLATQGDQGCLFFKYNNGSPHKARFYKAGEPNFDQLNTVLLCVDPGSDKHPRMDPVPPLHGCDPLIASTVVAGQSIQFTVASPVTTARVKQALETALSRKISPRNLAPSDSLAINEFMSLSILLGPWFPCTTGGCCRAW